MAAPIKITGDAILDAALELIRAGGPEALNARALARALGCSTQPIFRAFASMEALRRAVLERAHALYRRRVEEAGERSPYPPYKARGMAYIAFARAEPNLFRLLFMRGRSGETEGPEDGDWPVDTALAGTGTGLAGAEAELFHLEMWAVVHGIAVMGATGYLNLEEAVISRMLTDVFLGTRQKWEAEHNGKSLPLEGKVASAVSRKADDG